MQKVKLISQTFFELSEAQESWIWLFETKVGHALKSKLNQTKMLLFKTLELKLHSFEILELKNPAIWVVKTILGYN